MTATFQPRRHADGSVHIEVTVTYALRAGDLTQVLASAHRAIAPSALPLLRYTDAVTQLRRELRSRGGEAPFHWRDSFLEDDQNAKALETWARGEVHRLFPALRDSA
ncbi:hypothetical protein [Streptomyces qinglanensis]|uniref:hypothetical protein n=1 Tax=Streptomyces qinglanensis TaxID=943816 RepID=UPI003D74F41C